MRIRVLALLALLPFVAAAQTGPRPAKGAVVKVDCRMTTATAGLSGVTEASGVAISRRTPGILWSHGDSHIGEPYLFAFDAQGAVKGRIRLVGMRVTDWEDIDVGPCGSRTCIFVADIGDNRASRRSITIHRFPEPLPTEQSVRGHETFHATLPDGPNDAESIFVSNSGEMFMVTKGETGPVILYSFGLNPKVGAVTLLQKRAVFRAGRVPRADWVTGASGSPDGKWVALRTHHTVLFYDALRLMKGDASSPLWFDASPLREPQGEGVALGAAGALFLAGEAGRSGAPGTLSSGVCGLPTAAIRTEAR